MRKEELSRDENIKDRPDFDSKFKTTTDVTTDKVTTEATTEAQSTTEIPKVTTTTTAKTTTHIVPLDTTTKSPSSTTETPSTTTSKAAVIPTPLENHVLRWILGEISPSIFIFLHPLQIRKTFQNNSKLNS
jgi:hypothetical protein